MTATAAQAPPATAPQAPGVRHPILMALAVVPVLATVYQTIVLTDVTGDVIRKGVEGDSYQMLWTSLTWGIATLYGLFLGLWAMARIGARHTISIGLIIFAIGNGLCGASVDVPSLAFARLVEGIGKGMTIALYRSTLYRQFDRAILVAVAIYGVIAYSTRPFTPLVTAVVNDGLSWRWIYWVNVPIALLGLVLVRGTFLPDRPPTPLPLRIDWFAVTLFAAWVSCLLFTCGWYRRWGGGTSDTFAVTATLSAVLPLVLLAWSASGLSPDEHLARLIRVRGYVLAMCVRMLLLVNFSAVLAVLGKYLVELRDYPREVAGWVIAPAGAAMAATTLLTTCFQRRALRPVWLLVAVLGSAGSLWWLSGIDNFTPKEQVAAGLACWGLFLGLFPPVFLTDELEALERQDALYGGAVAAVFLVLPLLVVPIATGTAISAWTDRALDSQRLNLREERVAVREAQARLADDYRRRGVDGPELSTLTGTALGAFVKAESVARGFQDGLKFLSLTMLGLGLPLAA
ncbi:MAG TPA: MFS transporter, partial [Solirubrobacteraceae bacterium]|nr:MFS transporter [Solirubrobacteraceae bacterium]